MSSVWVLEQMTKYKLRVDFERQTVSRKISDHEYCWCWTNNNLHKTIERAVSIIQKAEQ